MYLTESKRRRTEREREREDRARETVVLSEWAEEVYQQFNDWLHSAAGDQTLTNLSRPPPIRSFPTEHLANYSQVPGTVHYNLSYPMDWGNWQYPLANAFWVAVPQGGVHSINNMIRGQSGLGRVVYRPRSWGYLQ